MGLNNTTALGRNQQFIIQPDQSSDTYPTFNQPDNTASNPPAELTILTSSMSYEQERKNRADVSQTRDYFERISGNKTVTWACESHLLIPDLSSSANRPDWHWLMQNAMGQAASSGSGPYVWTYSLTQGQDDSTPLTLLRELNGVLAESVWGAMCEEMTISVAQGDEPKLAFNGVASDYAITGTTTVSDGSLAAGDTVVTVADGYAVTPNSIIKIGSDTGAGNKGFKVTSISGNDITFTPGLSDPVAVTNGDAVIPFFDSDIDKSAATLVNGIQGQLDLGSVTDLEVNSFTVTVKNNFKPINEAFKATVQDMIPGRRDITGEIVVTGRKDRIELITRRYAFQTDRNMVARFGGNSSGDEKLTITIAKPEFDFSEVTIPEAEEVTVTLPFTALATTDTATDAISIAVTSVA